TPLPLPALGARVRFSKGPLELVIERHHGGVCVLTPHSDAQKRHYLGIPPGGRLELHARPPEFRVRVRLLDRVTLAPGGRLRGYVVVPLPHRLIFRREDGRSEPLLDVVPTELQTSWMGEGKDGGYLHETDSGFHLDRRGIVAQTVAIVPLVLTNHCEHAVSPEGLRISIRERDMREIDGQIVAAPRRLHFGDED